MPKRALTVSLLSVATAAVALPACALGSTAHGVVLLANQARHTVELVNGRGVVHGYRYGRGFPAVGFGSRLSYGASGKRIARAHLRSGRATRVSFYAKVGAPGFGAFSVRLADGTRITFSSSALVGHSVQLKAGETVRLTETRTGGKLLVSLHLAGPGQPASTHGSGSGSKGSGQGGKGSGGKGSGGKGSGGTGGKGSGGTGGTGSGPGGTGSSGPGPGGYAGPESTADGALTSIGSNALTLQLADGSAFSPSMPANAVSYLTDNDDLNDCQTLTVDYHQGTAGPVVDGFAPTGVSTGAIPESEGDTCADESDGGVDIVGSIAKLSSSSLTIDVPGLGAMVFAIDPSDDVLDGNLVGDLVDVSYDVNPDNSLSAWDVEYIEEYTTGTVTSVDSDTMTIKDTVTGESESFAPGDADFSSVSAGEAVGVVYYVSGGQPQADEISSLATGS